MQSHKNGIPEKHGKGWSTCYVEFCEHEHALCALRMLNNNPQVFGALVQDMSRHFQ
jgi:hypothetical protein